MSFRLRALIRDQLSHFRPSFALALWCCVIWLHRTTLMTDETTCWKFAWFQDTRKLRISGGGKGRQLSGTHSKIYHAAGFSSAQTKNQCSALQRAHAHTKNLFLAGISLKVECVWQECDRLWRGTEHWQGEGHGVYNGVNVRLAGS